MNNNIPIVNIQVHSKRRKTNQTHNFIKRQKCFKNTESSMLHFAAIHCDNWLLSIILIKSLFVTSEVENSCLLSELFIELDGNLHKMFFCIMKNIADCER